VVVKVNDRGPFHDNRLIDLSYAAAYKLGVVATGTAPVEVTAVFADDPPLVHASASLPPSGGKPRLYVQVGAFIDQSNALSLRDRLVADQDSPVLIQTAQSGGTSIYRVRIGPLRSVEEGDRVIADIDRQGIRDPKLVIE
jgi:rare lipoprotein A